MFELLSCVNRLYYRISEDPVTHYVDNIQCELDQGGICGDNCCFGVVADMCARFGITANDLDWVNARLHMRQMLATHEPTLVKAAGHV